MNPVRDGINVRANCPDCDGAVTTFEGRVGNAEFGIIKRAHAPPVRRATHILHETHYRFLRCAGCGRAGVMIVELTQANGTGVRCDEMVGFYPRSIARLRLPKGIPDGIVSEFRESELCASVGAYRSACAMLRSVLEKTLKINGYTSERNLEQRIDAAAKDSVITASRQRRAHDEVRVLGNDILHDEWKEVTDADYESAHFYAQRILEDFYDERQQVESVLKTLGRVKDAKPTENPAPVAAGVLQSPP